VTVRAWARHFMSSNKLEFEEFSAAERLVLDVMNRSRWWLAVALAVMVAGAPAGLRAEDDKNAKKAKQETAGEKPKEEKPAEKPKESEANVSAGPDGFVIQSGNPDYRIRIGGYAQADGRFYSRDTDSLATDNFLLRRARPIVQGTVAKYFDFYLNPDFGQGQVVLFDAYLNVRTSSKLQFRIGKFKPPVGLERLQSAQSLLFVERALPAALVPNRDVGAQVHGELGGGVVAYALGVFDGAVDGALIDTDGDDSKDVAGRLFFQPFARGGSKALKGLGLGFSATTGKQQGTLPSFRSGGQVAFFSYLSTAAADGTRTRFSPQGSFYAGPVGVLGEYVRSRQQVRRATDVARIENEAWEVSGSVVLTGEAATAGGVRPRRSFDPTKGTWGALELAVRLNRLNVDGAAFSRGFADPARSAREARAWAVGLNWYLNRNVKYVVDYERTTFTGGATVGDRRPENAILVRSQVAF
jgi:phosphate-selective porin OprO and OprP